MAITFVAAATAAANTPGTPEITVAVPSGTQSGDVMIATIYVAGDLTLAPPSGWTQIRIDAASSVDDVFHAWYRVAGSSEPASYTWSKTSGSYSTADMGAIVATYRGVDTASPVDVEGLGSSSTKQTSVVAPSVTTTGGDTRVLRVHCTRDDTTLSTPAGTTLRAQSESVLNVNASIQLVDATQAAAGASGTSTSTSGTSNEWVGYTVALAVGNEPPNAPNLVDPTSSETVDLTSVVRFDWEFSDPDVGDTQSQYDLQIRPQGDVTLTVDATQATTDTFHDLAADTLTADDYEWRVRTYDALGEVGAWSGWEPFVAASPPAAPSITDPTVSQNVGSNEYDVVWSTPNQAAYQLRKVADDGAGNPDTGTVYFDTGTVESATARSRTVDFPTNNRDEHIQVRVRHNTLWSTWATVRVSVAYTPPASPTVQVTPDDPAGSLTVTATHPAPSGSEPTVASMDVYRRVTAEGGEGIRVAAALDPVSSHTDWAVASGTDYEYRVKAIGDTGTTAYSAWTGGD